MVTDCQRRWWLQPPSWGVFLLAAHLAAAMARPEMLVSDPGTGWHLMCGRVMMESGRIIRADPFSAEFAGTPWLMNDWLALLGLGFLERMGGIQLLSAVGALVYGLIPLLLFRRCIRDGADPVSAFVACGLAYGVLMMHASVRPHMATYLFMVVLLERLERLRGTAREWPVLAVLAGMMVVWVNLHGGFAAGLVVAGIHGVGGFVEWLVSRTREAGRRLAGLMVVGLVLGLASLLNPHGWNYHFSILEYLGRESVRYWQEWRPTDFEHGGSAVVAFELMILALVWVLAAGRTRLRAGVVLTLVYFLHEALHSWRHTNLFAIAAAPVLALGLSAMLARWPGWFQVRLPELVRLERRAPVGIWVAGAVVAVVVLAATGRAPFRADLLDVHLSRGAAAFLRSRPEVVRSRIFNTDDLGGALVHEFWPAMKVFMDDRDFYPESFVMKRYLPLAHAWRGWRDVLAQARVDWLIVSSASPLFWLLREEPGWLLEYGDAGVAIFRRAKAIGKTEGLWNCGKPLDSD